MIFKDTPNNTLARYRGVLPTYSEIIYLFRQNDALNLLEFKEQFFIEDRSDELLYNTR